MKKWLLKILMPSDTGLAELMASAIRTGVNSATASKEDMVAKYARIAETATEVGNKLAVMMSDGTISADEESQLREMLLPVAIRIRELI